VEATHLPSVQVLNGLTRPERELKKPLQRVDRGIFAAAFSIFMNEL